MNSPFIAAIDIGNTSTDIGLFHQSNLLEYDFFPSQPEYGEKICQTIHRWQKNREPFRFIIGSVVPALTDLYETTLQTRFESKPLIVDDFKTQIIPLLVDRPETVGADRILNCYAAIRLFGPPAIVVSLGTATTFEAISDRGEYLGGAIAPGVKISLETLTSKTALLPPGILEKPSRIVAKNTVDQMRSGIYHGTLGMIEGMIRRFKQELGDHAKVIGAGGISAIFASERVFDHHDPHLTLKGLNEVYFLKN